MITAVLFGGVSDEYEVSLQSAFAVLSNINYKKHKILPIGITKKGEWLWYSGSFDNIKNNIWHLDSMNCTPVIVSQSISNKGVYIFTKNGVKLIGLTAVLPVLHGKNGEDGTVQGLFSLCGIKIIGCKVLSSALCMDKHRSHLIASQAGVSVPKGNVITQDITQKELAGVVSGFSFPLFVKPVCGGSSYGISMVQDITKLQKAIDIAFKHDNAVLLEEKINGFEVGCAILGKKTLTVGRVDEIQLADGFFDYNEKYTLKTAKIHCPARISSQAEKDIIKTAISVYNALGCEGFARVDLFYTDDKKIVFNEVNTIPGFTQHSRFPSMLAKAGIPFSEVIERLLSGEEL